VSQVVPRAHFSSNKPSRSVEFVAPRWSCSFGCLAVERMLMRKCGMHRMERFWCVMRRQRCKTVTLWLWG